LLKIWVSQFVEICIERNTVGWGGGGIENVIEYRLKKRLKNASEPSMQAEIAPPPIPNSIFFWGREGPGFPAKLARMALVKGLR